MANFRWTKQLEEAAVLIADGMMTHQEIADKLGVHRVTVTVWNSDPKFKARVAELIEAFRISTLNFAISRREKRVAALQDRWSKLQRVIEERSTNPKLAKVEGGTTGLIVHNVKGLGKGDDFQLIDLYEVDTGLLKELREHEKQAAQELGQWVEKGSQELSGPNGGPIQAQLESFNAALSKIYPTTGLPSPAVEANAEPLALPVPVKPAKPKPVPKPKPKYKPRAPKK